MKNEQGDWPLYSPVWIIYGKQNKINNKNVSVILLRMSWFTSSFICLWIYLLIYLLPNRVTWIWSFSGKGHETCSPFWKHFIAACVGKAPTMESTQGHGGGTWNSWCWVLRMWQRHQGGCSRQLQFCEEGRAHFWPGQGPKDFVVDATYIRVCCHGELGILDLLFARMHLWSSINKISSLLLEGWRVETPQPFWIGLVLVVARSAA